MACRAKGAWIGYRVAGFCVLVQIDEAECGHRHEGFDVIVEYDSGGTAVVVVQ